MKVVLTGQGADEPFGGYPRHLAERYGWAYRRLPSSLGVRLLPSLVEALPRNERLKRVVRSVSISDEIERLVKVYTVLDEELSMNRPRRQGGYGAIKHAVSLWHADAAKLDPVGKMMYVDARFSLADDLLLLADKLSMAVSLEARVPFLDVERWRRGKIPGSMKISGRNQKHILKRAVAKWLPDEILRRKKIGFSTPVDGWLRREVNGVVKERLLAEGSACRSFFQPEVVARMLREHEEGRHDHKRILFSLLTLCSGTSSSSFRTDGRARTARPIPSSLRRAPMVASPPGS